MQKTNCNIIKDLLPSYIDELCSTESKTLIEEHFEECSECKKIYEQTKLVLLHKNSTSVAEVDYLKKIKTNVSHKNTVIMLTLAILFLVEIYYNLILGISNYYNYLFPLLMGGLLFVLLPDYAEKTVPIPLKLKVLGAELAAIIATLLLHLYTGYSILNNKLPFGTKPENIGPFLKTITLIVLAGITIAFVVTLCMGIKKETISPVLIFVPLGGISFLFECLHFLHEFDTRFTLMHLVDPLMLFSAEVFLLLAVYLIINRKHII